jgi:hypothetical protein
MIVDEFRDSIAIYDGMLRDGQRDPLTMLNIVDKRLADISNHITVCHRVLAEQRGLANGAFLGSTRKRHLDKVAQACEALEQVIAVQAEIFEFRHKVLSRVAAYLRGGA